MALEKHLLRDLDGLELAGTGNILMQSVEVATINRVA